MLAAVDSPVPWVFRPLTALLVEEQQGLDQLYIGVHLCSKSS